MPSDEPTPETFGAELDEVVARHNELFQQVPGYMVAMLIHEASYRADQHGIEIDLLEAADDVYLFSVGESAAALSDTQDAETLGQLDSEIAMLDHRGFGEGPA